MRFFISSLTVILIYFMISSEAFASGNRYITIVNPVRGDDFFQLQGVKPEDNFRNEWDEIKKRNLLATWLIRPDALSDEQVVEIAKSLNSNQELGLFMEVTPTWTGLAGVKYRESQNWHFAGSVFLTGYEVEERHKLIDAAFEQFKGVFGLYPKSVGAWWIDAQSLVYMKEKYGIVANMDVADQFSTDNYQIWGQYFSTPFYPAKRNALIPASSEDQKIGVVTIQWASRDPYNSFGNGVLDSTYSVQANDYANKKYHSLDVNYFNKLLTVYLDNPHSSVGQVTVGLENDFSWEEYGEEYKRQLDVVLERQKKGTRVETMEEFASSYKSSFPDSSPPHIIFTPDPLGSSGYVLWYQNTKYRVGWFYGSYGSVIKDLRIFFDSQEEPCLLKSCSELNLATAQTGSIDDVTYKNGWIIDEGRISEIKLKYGGDNLELSYTNQAGVRRIIKFLQNDISLDGQPLPIQVWISRALEQPQKTKIGEDQFNYQLINGPNQVFNQAKNFIIFTIFVIFAFYLPGAVLFKKSQIEKNHKFLLAICTGISLFTLLSFILGFLNLSLGILVLPVISLVVLRKDWIIPQLSFSRDDFLALFLIVLGSFTWLLTTVKNGLIYDFGMGFWGPHGHDGIWHLGLIEAIKNGMPPQNPAFAGGKLFNYHYFYDLLLAQTSIITSISPVDLYFRFFPVLLSLTTGGIVYVLASKWFSSNKVALLSLFFIYFGGSFGWILSYFKDRSFGGETAFWAQQAISTLINPPFAISILLFFAGLYLFHKVVEQKSKVLPLLIPLIILWGTLIEFKAYAGILVLGSLAVVTVVELMKRKVSFLLISVPAFILSLLVFLPNNSGSGTLLVFSPFWLIHSMIDSPDRVGWYRLQLARMAGEETGNWFKFIAAEAVGLAVFLIGNLGTRIIGFISFKSIWPVGNFNLFLITFLGLAFVLPLIFIQKGANFNTVQFFYYFLSVFSFFAASSCYLLIKKFKIFGKIIVIILVLATIPITLGILRHYLPARPPARISNDELEALSFLKHQPDGTVLSYYYDKNLKERFTEPIPIFAYESTMYVSALTGKGEYIADTVNLNILGTDYKGRLQVQKDIYSLKESEMVKKLLTANEIKYVYLPKIIKISADENFGLRKIFENNEVLIYERII